MLGAPETHSPGPITARPRDTGATGTPAECSLSLDTHTIRRVTHDLHLAQRIVAVTRDAARLIHEHGLTVTRKSNASDLVTDVDLAIEARLREGLDSLVPGAGFLGEEGTSRPAPTLWVVDPIDGTTNLATGSPRYAVSVALVDRGEPVFGVILAGPEGHCTLAGLGHPDSLTPADRREPPSGAGEALASAVVSFGIPYDLAERARMLQVMARIAPRVRDVRRTGSAALDLRDVALGVHGAHVEGTLHAWDVAAAAALLAATGQGLSTWAGRPLDLGQAGPLQVLAGSADVTAALRELLRDETA